MDSESNRNNVTGSSAQRGIALACGGPGDPDEMQWQTTVEAKAKNKWKRIGFHGAKRQPTEGSEVASQTSAHTGVDCAPASTNQQSAGYFRRSPPKPVLPAVFPVTAD